MRSKSSEFRVRVASLSTQSLWNASRAVPNAIFPGALSLDSLLDWPSRPIVVVQHKACQSVLYFLRPCPRVSVLV